MTTIGENKPCLLCIASYSILIGQCFGGPPLTGTAGVYKPDFSGNLSHFFLDLRE